MIRATRVLGQHRFTEAPARRSGWQSESTDVVSNMPMDPI